MSKFLSLSLMVLLGFFSMQAKAEKSIHLAPQEAKQMTNHGLWTLNATCTIQEGTGKIKVLVLKNKGTVNGRQLSSGQATYITVADNSSISVSAESGTQINLINLGSKHVHAVCSV